MSRAASRFLVIAMSTLLATGWQRSRDGRKRLTSTALYTDDGDLVGRSEQVWIAVR